MQTFRYRFPLALELLLNSPLLRINSALALTLPSCAGLVLDELLLLLLRREASGSPGDSPLARARMLRMSVKLTTPLSRPLMLAPGICEAETADPIFVKGVIGVCASLPVPGREGVEM